MRTYAELPGLMTQMTGDEKHGPSATSTLDVLWVLYDQVLRVSPDTVGDPGRDRFLLSKGHGPAAYYAVLAAKEFFPESWLAGFGSAGSRLGYHPDRSLVPGVEIASGSLGHGLPIGVGVAHGLLARGLPGLGDSAPRVYVLVGDAELDEGSNSEAIVYAGGGGPAEPHRGRGRQPVLHLRLGAGRDRGALRRRRLVDHAGVWAGPFRAGRRVPGHRGWRGLGWSAARGGDRRGQGVMVMPDMRTVFAETASALLDEDPLAAVVLAEISVDMFGKAAARHPDRVLNVGIREQLMVSVGGGLALAGMRPIVHTYAPFLVERAYEQVKLDLAHQDAHAVLVSIGASYDSSSSGRTHQAPEDVALLDSVPGFSVVVPGHPAEVEALLRGAVDALDAGSTYLRLSTETNLEARPVSASLQVVRSGRRAVVVAVGPVLAPVLDAVADLDVTVAYATTVRPFDVSGLRALEAGSGAVVLVEPYLAGTSSHAVASGLTSRPHRLLSLGVPRTELRQYGTPADHASAYGLDAAGIRRSVTGFLGWTS